MFSKIRTPRFAGFHLILSGSKIRCGLSNISFTLSGIWYNQAETISSLALSLFQGVIVILYFHHYITHLSIPLLSVTISPSIYLYPNFSTFGRTLCLTTVLLQIAGSNTSIASASPSVYSHSNRVGLHEYRTSGLSGPLGDRAAFAFKPNFARWDEGTFHSNRNSDIKV